MEQSEIETLVEEIDPVDAFILGIYDAMERQVLSVPPGTASGCYVEYAKLPNTIPGRLLELAEMRLKAHIEFHTTGVRVEVGEP